MGCGRYVLATVLVDYLGRRVVAQSIIPGILRKVLPSLVTTSIIFTISHANCLRFFGVDCCHDLTQCVAHVRFQNHQNTIVYGINDVEEKMVIDPTFSDALKACSPALFVDEHKVKYNGGDTHTLHSSSECKGIAGIDGRFYVLDLIRTTPIDTNFAAAEYLDADDVAKRGNPVVVGEDEAAAAATTAAATADSWQPRHKLCLLRPELLVCYRSHIAGERAEVAKAANEGEGAVINMEDFRFNLDAFTYVELADTTEKVAIDRKAVKAAGDFLLQRVVPHFVEELKVQQVGAPLHRRIICG